MNRLLLLGGRIIRATNLTMNGDFSNSTTGWIHYGTYSRETIEDGWLRSTVDTARPYFATDSAYGVISGSKVYISFLVRGNKSVSADTRIKGYKTGVGLDSVAGDNVFNIGTSSVRRSFVVTTTDTLNGFYVDGRGYTDAGDYIEIDNFVAINMNASGIESLTLAEMDILFPNWFGGEITVRL